MLAGAVVVVAAVPAAAQVRDAVYRGTLVCDKLPFSASRGREAIEVTIAGGTVRYSHVVRLRDVTAQMTNYQDMRRFHTSVVHKLRTPLIAMHGSFTLLASYGAELSGHEVEEFARTALIGIERLKAESGGNHRPDEIFGLHIDRFFLLLLFANRGGGRGRI